MPADAGMADAAQSGAHISGSAHPRVIGFVSPQIGTGRTCTAATAAAVLAASGDRVLLLDCCPGRITLHHYLRPFHLEPSGSRDRSEVQQPVTLDQLQARDRVPARYSLPMDLGDLAIFSVRPEAFGDSEEAGRRIRDALRGLAYDYVLIDYPAELTEQTAAHVSALCDVAVLCYTPHQTGEAASFLRNLRDRRNHVELQVVAVPTVPSRDVDDRWQSMPPLDEVPLPPRDWPVPADPVVGFAAPPVTTVQITIKGYQMPGIDQVLPLFVEERESLTPYAELVAAMTDGAVADVPEVSAVIRSRYRKAHGFPTDNTADVVTLMYANADRPWADWLTAQLRRGGLDVQTFAQGITPAGQTRCVISSTHLQDSPAMRSALREMVAESTGAADLVWVKAENDGPPPPGVPAMTIDLAGVPTSTPASMICAKFGIVRPRAERPGQPRLPAPPDHQTLSLPARNPAFVGREDLLMDLRDQLVGEGAHHVTFGGGPGVGKSEIVREYAYRFAYDYDVVWWIPAQDVQSVLASLTTLAAQLPIKNRADAARAAVDALEAQDAPRALLIYDNADDPTVLDGLVPKGIACHVLITSRHPDARSRFKAIDAFRSDESVAMLTKRVPGLPDKVAADVAAAVDQHPLALRMASAWLRETIPTIRRSGNVSELRAATWVSEELIRRLNTTDMDFPESLLDTPQIRTVGRALSIVLSTMRAADLHLTVRLAELAAFLSPDGASLNLLRSPSMLRLLADERHAVPEDDDQRQPSQIAADEGYADVVFWSGTRYGLFEVDWGWRGQVRIHRAVQDLLKGAMNGERTRRQSQIQRALADYAPTDPQVEETAYAPTLEELQRHFEYCEAAASTDDNVRHWVTKQIRYLYRLRDRATWEAALALAEKAASTWREAGITDDDPLLRRLRMQTANLYRALGDNATAQRIDEELLAADPHAELRPTLASLRVRRGLAGDLRGEGRFADALEHDKQVQEGLRGLLGRDHRDTLMSQHNLAISRFLAGFALSALQTEEEVYRAYLRLMGPAELRVWRSLSDIGMYQRELGRFRQSMATLQEAREGIRRVRGLENNRNHVDVLRIRRNIEITERCLARPGFSSSALLEVTESYVEVLGRDHPDTYACRLSLAAAYRVEGRPDIAVSTAAECLAGYEQHLTDGHPFRAACLVNLSAYRQRQGDSDTAVRQAWRGYDSMVEQLGQEHQWSLAAAVNLAVCQYSARQHAEALRLLTKTAEVARLTLTKDHPFAVAARTNLDLLRSETESDEWVTLDIDVPQT